MNETIVALPNGDFWVDRRINPDRRKTELSTETSRVLKAGDSLSDNTGKFMVRSTQTRRIQQKNR